MGLGESLALVEKLRQAWRGAGNPAVRSTEPQAGPGTRLANGFALQYN